MNTLPSPRWAKVINDLWENKVRTMLVVLGIAVGVFAFGSMFITRRVLVQNMNEGFALTNPATITFTLSSFDESLLRTARTFPYVEEVAASTSAQVQVWNGRSWSFLSLMAVPDFERMTINRIELEAGTLDPARGEILLERQSLPRLPGVGLGDTIRIELPDGSKRDLTLVGVVHDFNAAPASIVPILTGYVSLDTLNHFGLSSSYDQLLIKTDPALTTQAQLEVAADEIGDLLDRYGHTVFATQVTPPGQHWASDFIAAVVLVLMILGLLALGLSGFLVINTVTSLLTQQKRQIGMMKAIGASGGQVASIYLAMSGAYGLLAFGIALPVGVILSWGMNLALANFLNVNTVRSLSGFVQQVPAFVILLQAATGVLTPLVAGLIPVLLGVRTTVREAISDYGIGAMVGTSPFDRWLASIRGLPRPTLLSLRNTFRRKGRLALTLIALASAGAIFIAVLNTRLSLLRGFDQILAMFGYDVQVILSEPQPVSRLQREAIRVAGVERVEGWGFASATILRPAGVTVATPDPDIPHPRRRGGPPNTQAAPEEGTAITIFAPPPDTQFIEPTMLEGRWLQPGDRDALVLASEVLNTEPYIRVGDRVRLDFGDTKRTMEVVGIVNLVGPQFGYASFDYITRLQGAAGQSFVAIIRTTSRNPDVQDTVAREVEEHFQEVGIPVFQAVTISSFMGAMIGMVNFFVAFMLFMAVLLGVVGGLGLASTMSLNVLERTREIGVMRAIGSSHGSMRGIFMSEGVLIGLFSYAIAILLSLPVTYGFVVGVGNAFFNRPLGFAIAPVGYLAWLGVVLFLSALASFLPAQRAASVSVREALAYE